MKKHLIFALIGGAKIAYSCMLLFDYIWASSQGFFSCCIMEPSFFPYTLHFNMNQNLKSWLKGPV